VELALTSAVQRKRERFLHEAVRAISISARLRVYER
jgi:hypothetical protein